MSSRYEFDLLCNGLLKAHLGRFGEGAAFMGAKLARLANVCICMMLLFVWPTVASATLTTYSPTTHSGSATAQTNDANGVDLDWEQFTLSGWGNVPISGSITIYVTSSATDYYGPNDNYSEVYFQLGILGTNGVCSVSTLAEILMSSYQYTSETDNTGPISATSLSSAGVTRLNQLCVLGYAAATYESDPGYDNTVTLTATNIYIVMNTGPSPAITWPTPTAIAYGIPLSSTQLNATTSVPGTFTYYPTSGTVLSAGSQTLSVTFVPTDTTDYNNSTASVTLTVNQVTPTVTWATPAAISYGTALSETLIPAGIIERVAGNPYGVYPGDGGLATHAVLCEPSKVVVDASGNLYIADSCSGRIRKVNPYTGIITTVAGGGTGCSQQTDSVGDGCSATSAKLDNPSGVAVDTLGNIYIADNFNFRIRKVTASTGLISTVAGSGAYGYSGDGGLATRTALGFLQDVAIDGAGNIYITSSMGRLLEVTATTGIITTVAGNGTYGYSGDGGQATRAEISTSQGVAVDPSGNIYFADRNNSRIRKVTASTHFITTVAGGGSGCSQQTDSVGDGCSATNAVLNLPDDVTLDASGNIYIADTYNTRVRKVAASTGIITTVAGGGTGGYSGDGGLATSAELSPYGVALDAYGNIYIADYSGSIRAVGTSQNLGATQLNATANIPGTFVYTPVAGTVLGGGSQTLSATFNPTDYTDYSTATASVMLNVTLPTPTLSVASSSNPSTYGGSVTFTATISSGPTGTVTFYDGTAVLGTGNILTGGTTATFTTSALTAGTHAITASWAGNSNYGAVTSAAITQRVTQAALTITASSPTVGYGSGIPTITPSYSGWVNGQNSSSLTTQPTCTTTYTPTSAVGSSPSTRCSGAVDANYSISYVAGTVTVTQAPLTITASSPTVGYGGAVPTITPIYSGWMNGQSASSLTTQPTCTTAYTTTSAVGSLPSTSCSGAVAANYSISYVPGTVTVTQMPLTITASSPTVGYGGAVPTITPSYSGWMNGQSSSSLTNQPTCTTAYTTTSAVGSSPSTSCSGAVDANYSISYVAGKVTVTQAPETITASSPTVSYGGAVPTITPIYGGWMNGQSASSLTTQPTCTTAYTTTSAVGSSPSTSCSGAVDANYNISYVAGKVTVGKVTPTITWPAQPFNVPYNTASSVLSTYASTGGVAGTFTFASASPLTQIGLQTLPFTFTPSDRVDFSSVSGTITVTVVQATPIIVWNPPAAIAHGTALSATQLNAQIYDANSNLVACPVSIAPSVPNTCYYTPAANTVLHAGPEILTVTYTPSNTTDYTTVTDSVTLNVNKTIPIITWPTPASISDSAALSAVQLNAVVTDPTTGNVISGNNVYTSAGGTILTAGSILNTPGEQLLTVTFTPTDTADYAVATARVAIRVTGGAKYDTGTVTLTVGGATVAQYPYGQSDTPSTVAEGLAAHASGSLVTLTAVDDTLNIVAIQSGSASDLNYTLQAVTNDPTDFPQPSFVYNQVSGTLPPGTSEQIGYLDGGAAQNTTGATVYSYCVGQSCPVANNGYDPAGNLLGYTDSVMGQWGFTYDNLNRLITATAASASVDTAAGLAAPFAGSFGCWSYDDFGNRLSQSISTTPCSSGPTPMNWAHYNSRNQITASTQAPGGPTYDNSGDVTNDGAHQYLYDAEGRICAVYTNPVAGISTMTGYLYDADGTRIAKGSISAWSCDPAQNGFQTTNDYILGLGGEQLTEMGMGGTVPSGATTTGLVWQHANIWSGGKLLGTYDNDGLHFYLDDPLGTRRAQTNFAGVLEQTCQSLPYGDALTCVSQPDTGGNLSPYIASLTAPTEHHFTGKERDAESGNDYFEARYYSSSMGRWISPDWSIKEEPVPYAKLDDPQTLNLYAYVMNNPLARLDLDGHYTCRGSSEDCAGFVTALNMARVAMKHFGPESDQAREIQGVLDFYGSDTTKNKVFVSFGKLSKGTAGITSYDAKGNIRIKFDLAQIHASTKGFMAGTYLTERAGIAIHEGTHGSDERKMGHGISNRHEEMKSERHAYRTESYVNEGFSIPTPSGLWSGDWSGADFEKNRSAAIEAGATASTNEACKKGCKP